MMVGDLVKRVYGGGTGLLRCLYLTGDLGILKKIDETNGIAYVYWCEKQIFLWTKMTKVGRRMKHVKGYFQIGDLVTFAKTDRWLSTKLK